MGPEVLIKFGTSSASWSMAILESPVLTASEKRSKTVFVTCHIFTISTLLPLVIFIKLLKIKRSQVLLNLFLALCLNSTMALLMGFSPKHPARALCLVSSAGSRAGTALISVAVMNTVLMVWRLVRQSSGMMIYKEKYFNHMLLWLPWAVYSLVLLINVIYLLIHPQLLYVDVMTCYSKNICATISHIAAIAALLVTLVFNVWSVISMILLRRQTKKRTDVEREMVWSLESSDLSTPVTSPVEVRIMAYSVTVLGGLIVSVILYAQPHSHIPAVYQSACGVCCFLIFGTQPDIWRGICRLVCSGQSSQQASSGLGTNFPSDPIKRPTLASTSLPFNMAERPSFVLETIPISTQGCTTLISTPPLSSTTGTEPNVRDRSESSTDGKSIRASRESNWSKQEQDYMVGLVPCLMYGLPDTKPRLMGLADTLADPALVPDEPRV